MKRNILATSVALATLFLSTGQNAWAADDQVLAKLQAQLEVLQQQVNSLQQNQTAAPPSGFSAAVAERAADSDEYVEEDTSGIIATKSDVDGLRAQFENYQYDQERLRERNTVKSARDTTFFGTVQTRIQNTSTPISAGNTNAWESRKLNFEVPLAQFGVRGNLYRDYKEGKNLTYQLSFGYAKRNGSNTSDLNLQDAFLQYSFAPTNGGLEDPKLTLAFGQQQIPFGQEAQSPEDLRPTITQARAIGQLGLGTRQIGLVLRGDLKPYTDYAANYRAPLLEYALGVTNGNGFNRTDDNNNKDYVGRLAFTLPVDYASIFRELKFGASYKKGESNIVGGTPTDLLTDKGRNDVLGLDIYYNHAPFGVTYEYYKGIRDTLQVASGNIAEVKSEGQTATLFYTVGDQFYNSIKTSAKFDDFWPKSIQAYYRYDTFDPNTSSKKEVGELDIHSAGLNFFFAQTTKFQLGLSRWNFANATQKDYTEVLAQFQYGF
ncbi:DUF3138 domain-containing protein [Acinetobacter sp. NIPH 2699]|uniref:DUF3138 domain-containing protein n=1 Tax=Acinetobacter sp. NIPH 2699 TaxID=2923433 RepID=UPI001F4B6A64|nr:DUF3138 domain-containing protein [Acinetobacter sp. NIPH 2699]